MIEVLLIGLPEFILLQLLLGFCLGKRYVKKSRFNVDVFIQTSGSFVLLTKFVRNQIKENRLLFSIFPFYSNFFKFVSFFSVVALKAPKL